MAGRKITFLRQSGAACDHPIDPSYPEGTYLSNILLRVLWIFKYYIITLHSFLVERQKADNPNWKHFMFSKLLWSELRTTVAGFIQKKAFDIIIS